MEKNEKDDGMWYFCCSILVVHRRCFEMVCVWFIMEVQRVSSCFADMF